MTNFVIFGVLTAGSTIAQTYLKRKAGVEDGSNGSTSIQPAQSGSARSLWRSYIVVYALVMGELPATRVYASTPHPAANDCLMAIFYRSGLAARYVIRDDKNLV